MIDLKDEICITTQCKLLDISRSCFYYTPKDECEVNLKMARLLIDRYLCTPFYGYRKLTVWLRSQGFEINEKRVRRLMKIVNWKTIYREPRTTICNVEHKKYPYLLKGLATTHKNHVWATDITYIPMEKGFMYLAAIIDLHTRYVLNWSVSNTMSATWCTGVLEEAMAKHGKPEIFNTDQGSQYTSDEHVNLLLSNEIKVSMDGKGRAIDNIFIERLWRTVKYENVYLQAYSDGTSLNQGLRKYFEFYNNERFHQSLDYATPAQRYFQREVVKN